MKNRGFTLPKHGNSAGAAKSNLKKDPKVPADLVQPDKQASNQPQPNQPDTRDWLTRSEAADMLACSGQTLANYETKGSLHPQHAYRPDGRGVEHRVIVYSPHELKRLASRMNRPGVVSPRHAGEMTARAFELLEEGRSGREIIRELRLTVEELRELREKWTDEGGADLIISPNAKEALEKIVGPFSDVTQLTERVTVELFITSGTKEALEKIVGPFSDVGQLTERLTAELFITPNAKATLEQIVGPIENVHALIGLVAKKWGTGTE
jgi:hypothetical protein